MDRELLEALQGTVVSVWDTNGGPSSGKALGFKTGAAAYAAARRGAIPVIRLGENRLVTPCAPLRRMLGLAERAA